MLWIRLSRIQFTASERSTVSALTVTAKNATSQAGDAVIVLVAKSGTTRSSSVTVLGDAGPMSDLINRVAAAVGITGEQGSSAKVPSAGSAKAPLIVALGVGDVGDVDPEGVRRAVGSAVLGLAGKAKALVVAPEGVDLATAAAEGALLGAYSFREYKSDKAKDTVPVDSIVLCTRLVKDKALKAGVARAHVVAEAVHGARDLVNMPPLDLYPAAFADRAVALAADAGVSVSVLDDKQLQQQGYGGLTGVGQGSSRGPRLVRLEWNPAGTSTRRPRRGSTTGPALSLVGKGITFDSGGISIKPAANMEAMKSDMAGAAAVLHTVLAIARLKLPIRVTGWLCIAENMPSGTAQRPSDVITIYGGRTAEVLNTDAEGRLVLADGLVAASEEKPELIVDVATLTGAQTVALGNRVSAIMSNDDALRDRLFEVSKTVGEQFWPMPLPEELRASMDSPVADIANMGDRFGGMLVAGLFLKEFVGTVGEDSDDTAPQIPWAHLDIAGPALNTSAPFGYTPKGGTGVAVRTLLGLAEQLIGS